MNKSDWQRVSKRRPCPVCGKPDWCVYAGPAEAPTAVICARVESAKRCGEAGWLHVLRTDGPVWAPWKRTLRRAVRLLAEPANGAPDFAKLAEAAARNTPLELLERLADSLGLSAESLRRLGAGWLSGRRAWGFPMRDASGRIVGVRLRFPNGRKLSVKGGKEGLFIPEGLPPGGRLLVCEGPTDCGACLDWGFAAIGRPSCNGGVRHVVEMAQRLRPAEVVVVGDGDAPGRLGAERLASILTA